MSKRIVCGCGRRFHARTANHRSCPACGAAHRDGRRCESLTPCATCIAAFARLAVYNDARKHGGKDRDRRRGLDVECPCGCGATYAGFRAGVSFAEARRDFIVRPEDKHGKRRHGRRGQVLGMMHGAKKLAWNAMVAEHVAAKGAA